MHEKMSMKNYECITKMSMNLLKCRNYCAINDITIIEYYSPFFQMYDHVCYVQY